MKAIYFLLLSVYVLNVSALEEERIFWQQWGEAPFLKAKKENRMILLDVGMEGCTACRWMDEITYTDSKVIQLVNDHFIAIVADAEAQPDVGERYSDWAWPATIFMAPDTTQVLALAGNRRPGNFIPILEELIKKQANNQLEADGLAPYAAPPAPEQTELTKIRARVRAQLDSLLNETHGGWQQRGISTATGGRVEHLYVRAHMYSNEELRKLALATTDGYLAAIDPVWGGVFVQVFHDGDGRPERFKTLGAVPEKRISNQANALIAFSHAYKLTGEQKYLAGIEEVDRFLRDWMMHDDGTFYTSQEDDPPKLPGNMSTIEYWLLDSDSKRRRFGIPPIDHAIYTDKNGQAIDAYAKAYEATGDMRYLERASRAANTLLKNRMQPAGWILQATPSSKSASDNRMRPLVSKKKPFLSAQAWFGTALLSLYRASGDDSWLGEAEKIAGAMLAQLYDHDMGGFLATEKDDTASIIPARKPLEFNGRAAHFIYDLWIYTKDNKLAKIPEQTLRAVAVENMLSREGKIIGQTALALEKLAASYVEFSVVGDESKASTHALFLAGRQTYHPRKLLHYEKPGRYPVRKKAAMYICNPDRCSIPIEDPALVARQADSFRLPATFSP